MDCRHSAGNLHINLRGEFNGMCAWELFKILRRHDGAGRVFVNTHHLRQVAVEATTLFKAHMTRRQIPQDWLYFKGKKGFKIAPNGSRVLICKKVATDMENGPNIAKRPFLIIRH
jgi:hypothetical protein